MNNALSILAFAVPVAAALAGIFKMKYSAGKYSDLKTEIDRLELRICKLEGGKASGNDLLRVREDTEKHATRIAVIETNLININKGLDRMGDKLDEILKEIRNG